MTASPPFCLISAITSVVVFIFLLVLGATFIRAFYRLFDVKNFDESFEYYGRFDEEQGCDLQRIEVYNALTNELEVNWIKTRSEQ